MPSYCTKCKTNWAKLESQDDTTGDEQYEYCPICKTDTYLENARAGNLFIMTMTGGKKNITSNASPFPVERYKREMPIKNNPVPEREQWSYERQLQAEEEHNAQQEEYLRSKGII